MNIAVQPIRPETGQALQEAFELQRARVRSEVPPDYRQRVADLKQLKRMVSENREAIIDAISQDYGNRSRHESLFAEIITVCDGINDTIKRLKSWMKPEKRHVDLMTFPGASNRVVSQPLGVTGIIVPWNFPINLSVGPLTCAFAAGNRAIVKMSENSIHLSRLLIKLAPDYFPPEKLQIFEETGGVGIEFSKIPFDLLVFTGSGQTGRAVMAAAAQNLTPVVLELGGKAPAVVAEDYPIAKAVERIMYVKQLNAGQICTNVDYVFVPEFKRDEFIAEAKKWVSEHVPDINSVDYTSIIDARSVQRLTATLEDAKAKGATVINLCGDAAINEEARKFPLHIVADTNEEMTIRQRETFGPLLMLMTYTDHEAVIEYINARDRPLALYPFTNKRKLAEYYIGRVMSGGVTVNDALFHVAQHDLPFGGVGPSGMGHYHGRDGFLAFSKQRPIFYQAGFSVMKLLAPPYGDFADRVFNLLAKLKG